MKINLINKGKEQKAALSLEASVSVVALLLFIIFLIFSIRLYKVQLAMRHIIDQVASEMAIALPYAELKTTAAQSDFFDGELNADLEQLLAEGLLTAYISDTEDILNWQQFMEKRLNYWLGEGFKEQLNLSAFISASDLALIPSGENHLSIVFSYTLKLFSFSIEKQIYAAIPVWLDDLGEAAEDSGTEAEIWLWPNFTRGLYFRSKFEANLPINFPVIAKFKQKQAQMIKSIDLTAPSYKTKLAFEKVFQKWLKKLQSFQGGRYHAQDHFYEINPEDIEQRSLLLITPKNVPSYFNQQYITHLKTLARNEAIELELVQFGNSYKFTSP